MVFSLAAIVVASTALSVAQEVAPPVGGRGGAPAGRGAPPPSKPTPHWPDGRVNLGAPAGQSGIWAGDGRLAVNPKSYEPNSTRNALIHIDAIPLQPWARELTHARHAEILRFEPHARCNPSVRPREFVTPYGFEIVAPDIKRVLVLDIGGPHTFREIFMDGRAIRRISNPATTTFGGPMGGRTLVIDGRTEVLDEPRWIAAHRSASLIEDFADFNTSSK